MIPIQPPGDVNPPILTARLRLEPQVAAHAPLMMPVLADPQVHRYTPTQPPTDAAALRARYARLESRRSPDETELWLNWTVFRGAAAIGTVQASVDVAARAAGVAYVFAPAAWGQGYAAEATRAMLQVLRDPLGVRVATAHIDTRNAASQRLAGRLGFVRVREIVGADEFKGAVSDEFVYELVLSYP